MVEWINRGGEEVQYAVQDGTIETIVSSDPGIYVWKLLPNGRPLLAADPEGVLKRIRQLMTLPQADSGLKRITHTLETTGIVLRGQDFTPDKLAALRTFMVANVQYTQWVIDYLESLAGFLPSIYVGQSLNLAGRMADHINATSDFGKRMSDFCENNVMDWVDLSVSYCVLPNASSTLLSTVEFMTQSITVSGFTKRVG